MSNTSFAGIEDLNDIPEFHAMSFGFNLVGLGSLPVGEFQDRMYAEARRQRAGGDAARAEVFESFARELVEQVVREQRRTIR